MTCDEVNKAVLCIIMISCAIAIDYIGKIMLPGNAWRVGTNAFVPIFLESASCCHEGTEKIRVGGSKGGVGLVPWKVKGSK